ncbi:FAD-dependent oxidoreductase [Stieleria varia]|uniref:UDP-galactopyranose mutase n=1 Tax=Stieleria varia TaxID=2528005 RepID=A0A5C6B9L5_9BACT|nr:FAD-dependent oxidoreductase [Stieleria varia]TWU07956.1 UDP-galactopyranose mutase precursor [Stieleria varia]
MRVAVIGAGPAGLTAALKLRQGGADVDVFEASSMIGGLSRTIELWGQYVDIGPHRFFSTDGRVNQFWLDVVGTNYRMVDRLTRVHYQGELIDYPIRPISAIRQLGWRDAGMCLASYLRQKLVPGRSDSSENSFETWVTKRFGRRLYEHFFKAYSEKLWGIPCSELSSDFAAQRIRSFSLWQAVVSATSPRHANTHKTLVDRFAYPIGGTGAVYHSIATQYCQQGGRITTDCPVNRLICDGDRVKAIRWDNGQTDEFDHVISTMPLPHLIASLASESAMEHGQAPASVQTAAQQLSFRNTVLVYLHIDHESLFDDQWLYIQSDDVRIGRVTNFRNWIPEVYGESSTTVLAIEQWCNADDDQWRESDRKIIARCVDELVQLRLLRSDEVLDGHVIRIPRSYPVYRRGYRNHLDCVSQYLSGIGGLSVIGRYGAFKYNNQDHSILMGLLAAENVLHDASHDLWNVNSDFDQYQEKTLITENGLVTSVG